MSGPVPEHEIEWATDGTQLVPPSALIETGWMPRDKIPAAYRNYLDSIASPWVHYLRRQLWDLIERVGFPRPVVGQSSHATLAEVLDARLTQMAIANAQPLLVSGVSGNFNSVAFSTDKMHGMATAFSGTPGTATLWRTTDGGWTWDQVTDSLFDDIDNMRVVWDDSNDTFIVAQASNTLSATRTVYSNATGSSWSTGSSRPYTGFITALTVNRTGLGTLLFLIGTSNGDIWSAYAPDDGLAHLVDSDNGAHPNIAAIADIDFGMVDGTLGAVLACSGSGSEGGIWRMNDEAAPATWAQIPFSEFGSSYTDAMEWSAVRYSAMFDVWLLGKNADPLARMPGDLSALTYMSGMQNGSRRILLTDGPMVAAGGQSGGVSIGPIMAPAASSEGFRHAHLSPEQDTIYGLIWTGSRAYGVTDNGKVLVGASM